MIFSSPARLHVAYGRVSHALDAFRRLCAHRWCASMLCRIVFGGFCGEFLNEVSEFNFVTSQWSILSRGQATVSQDSAGAGHASASASGGLMATGAVPGAASEAPAGVGGGAVTVRSAGPGGGGGGDGGGGGGQLSSRHTGDGATGGNVGGAGIVVTACAPTGRCNHSAVVNRGGMFVFGYVQNLYFRKLSSASVAD